MDWISKQAKLYRNLALTHRYQAIVHLEDQEDERFWDYQLQHVKPGRYRYLYYSKNNNGSDTRGCEQCLRFRPYLTDQFFICIDSDLRLLRGEEGLTRGTGVAFKTDILDNSLHTNGYDEIEALQKDLYKILIQ